MSESITQSVGGKFVAVRANFTRPSNATQYTAGDIVSDSTSATTPMRFANCARLKGGSGSVIGAKLVTDNASDTAIYKLSLYKVTTPTLLSIPVDNAPATLVIGNEPYLVGSITFPAVAGGAGTNTAVAAQWNADASPAGPLPFVTYAGTGDNSTALSDLFGVLTTTGTPTPASGQKFYVELTILQN